MSFISYAPNDQVISKHSNDLHSLKTVLLKTVLSPISTGTYGELRMFPQSMDH